MTQQQLGLDPLSEGYGGVYAALGALRESFHRSGRLDDSNAKLDEVAKLFATYLAYRRGMIPTFPTASSTALVLELQRSFGAATRLPQYIGSTGTSIFGSEPKLALRDGDEGLAAELVGLVRQCVDTAFQLRDAGKPFDILNEAFGHFVRDNFRGNIEDAQYMTPPEVVDFIVDLALQDIQREGGALSDSDDFTVLDPSCGVGSFLATFYHRASEYQLLPTSRLRLYGQDKVERMARLATINMELFDSKDHKVYVGNSLALGSPIDALNGAVDLVLTNPPFGARFEDQYVRTVCGDNAPFFSSQRRDGQTFDSELLFIDRNLRLLKDGGRLFIVVPDGVVSAKGVSALLRQHLGGVARLKAIVELPAVTFAQAGTRTKTSVVYLQKAPRTARGRIFMSVVSDLGFQVSSRKGIQVKQPEGTNQLLDVIKTYAIYRDGGMDDDLERALVLSEEPSCVVVDESEVLRGSWTPSHYSAKRFGAIRSVAAASDFDLVALADLVEFCADARRATKWRTGMGFLSVLHVLGEGLVDVAAALTYAPKTPGVAANPGEILLSRINPRIPRVCIAPDLGREMLCSSEFEIMKTRGRVSSHLLTYLLLSESVQCQIRSLTSGTSASHNRIRTSELAGVLIPVPRVGSARASQLEVLAAAYREALASLSDGARTIAQLRRQEASVFGV